MRGACDDRERRLQAFDGLRVSAGMMVSDPDLACVPVPETGQSLKVMSRFASTAYAFPWR
jgi:hypothetical protein